MLFAPTFSSFFFFNDTATTEIYTLSLHDALPICRAFVRVEAVGLFHLAARRLDRRFDHGAQVHRRSEEHTSELQSHLNLVCRLLLEKKKTKSTVRVPSYVCSHRSPQARWVSGVMT